MATDLESRPRYQELITDQIGRVRQKIRLVDLGRNLLVLACLLFGYGLVVAVFDLWTGGSDSATALIPRLAAFAGFVGVFGYGSFRTILRYLTPVNPYFAARELEQTVDNPKNAVINWLDLHDKKLPPAIHQAVGLKAARAVKEADPELAASPRDLWRLAAIAGVFVLGLALLFLVVPRQFGSLMARAFLPIRATPLAANTTITLLKPAGGHATVPAQQRVEFQIQIGGRIPLANAPDAPALHYRQAPDDVFVRVPLDEDVNGNWGTRLGTDQVKSGLWYKFTAGDASTELFELKVRVAPFATRFDATYTYRPYRKIDPETVSFPNDESLQPRLLAHRGTHIALRVRANTPVKAGTIELDQGGKISVVKGIVDGADAHNLLFAFTPEKTGSFRLAFESVAGEKNFDRSAYPMDILEDGPPLVELLQPGKDIAAPTNGTVLLAGLALDDFGITGLTLQLQLGKDRLAPIPYQPKKPLRFDNGTYQVMTKYVEVLALDQLLSAGKNRVTLSPGQVLTYWLEARDNFDYPAPHVGASKVFKIKLEPPSKDQEKQKKERQDAQNKKEKHEDQQKKESDSQTQDNQKGGDGKKDQPSSDEQRKKDLENKLDDAAKKLNEALNDNKEGDKKDSGSEPMQKPSGSGNEPKEGPGSKEGPENPSGASKSPMNPDGKDGKGTGDPMKNPASKGGEKDGPMKGDPKKGTGEPDMGKNGPSGKESSAKKNEPKDGKGAPDSAPDGPGSTGKEKSPSASPKDDKSPKEKGGDGSGTAKSIDKADPSAKKGEGPTTKNAKEEKLGSPPDGTKTKQGDPKGSDTNPGAKQSPGKEPDAKDPSVAKGLDKEPGKKPEGPPSPEEFDKLKDILKKGGPEADKAAKELVDRAKDVDDPALKKAVEDVLKEAGRKDELREFQGGEKLPMPMAADDKGDPKGNDPKGAKDGDKEKGPSAGVPMGKLDEGKTKDGEKSTAPSPLTGPKARNEFNDELKAITPEEAFRRRLGNLQIENLEDLKKRITPDLLKKANMSEGEWQDFLKNARAYQKLIQSMRQRDNAKILKNGVSKILSKGPRAVDSNPGATFNPQSTGIGAPPPEFQDAHQRFTRKKE